MTTRVAYNILEAFGVKEPNWLNRPIIKWLRENVQEIDPKAYPPGEYPYEQIWAFGSAANDKWMTGHVEFNDSVPEEVITSFRLTWGIQSE